MSYRIDGLSCQPFEHLFGASEQELARHNARRVVADSKPGFPCRVILEDAEPGEELLLLNYVSLETASPFRTAYAIYVREALVEHAIYVDELPPALRGRTLSLRGFDEEGMLRAALLTQPGEAEAGIHELFDQPEIATIHAHNAIPGCFAARIERN